MSFIRFIKIMLYILSDWVFLIIIKKYNKYSIFRSMNKYLSTKLQNKLIFPYLNFKRIYNQSLQNVLNGKEIIFNYLNCFLFYVYFTFTYYVVACIQIILGKKIFFICTTKTFLIQTDLFKMFTWYRNNWHLLVLIFLNPYLSLRRSRSCVVCHKYSTLSRCTV